VQKRLRHPKKSQELGVNYSFLFMRADGKQLQEISKLIEKGAIRPVVNKVFPFEQTKKHWNMWRADVQRESGCQYN